MQYNNNNDRYIGTRGRRIVFSSGRRWKDSIYYVRGACLSRQNAYTYYHIIYAGGRTIVVVKE